MLVNVKLGIKGCMRLHSKLDQFIFNFRVKTKLAMLAMLAYLYCGVFLKKLFSSVKHQDSHWSFPYRL